MKIEFTSPRRDGGFGGWSRNCTVDGVAYQVSVSRGRSVRIPFKPRGKNRGWKWNGAVYCGGKCIWSDAVTGSIGARGMLIAAGVIAAKDETPNE